MPRFTPVKAFTNTAIFGSSPPTFFPNDGLKPPSKSLPNPSSGNGDRLLLLLFLEGGLLLPPSKTPNPLNGFVPIIPKCEKYSPPVFTLLVAFC